jgi:hypothetical protein
MASLIEDLAREMKVVKSESFLTRKESLKTDPEKIDKCCAEATNAVEDMKKELENIKNQVSGLMFAFAER